MQKVNKWRGSLDELVRVGKEHGMSYVKLEHVLFTPLGAVFQLGLTEATEKTEDRQASVGMGKGAQMTCIWKLKIIVVDRVQVRYKMIA